MLNKKYLEIIKKFRLIDDITEHDVLKGDQQIYHIERVVRETNKTFGDGTHIIYVNGNIRCGSLLGDLMHNFFCTNPEDRIHRQLARRVAFLKNNEQEARKMCELIEELLREERE